MPAVDLFLVDPAIAVERFGDLRGDHRGVLRNHRPSLALRLRRKQSWLPSVRPLPAARSGTFFAKRSSKGRFKEMDEQGHSLATNRRRKAKTRSKSGYGDKGDRRVA